MKTNDLQNFGVNPLSEQEMKNVNGGNPYFRLARAVLAAAAAIHDVLCDGTPHNTNPSFHVMDRGAW